MSDLISTSTKSPNAPKTIPDAGTAESNSRDQIKAARLSVETGKVAQKRRQPQESLNLDDFPLPPSATGPAPWASPKPPFSEPPTPSSKLATLRSPGTAPTIPLPPLPHEALALRMDAKVQQEPENLAKRGHMTTDDLAAPEPPTEPSRTLKRRATYSLFPKPQEDKIIVKGSDD